MTPVNTVSVVVYGSEDCGRCKEVKDALKANGILFSSEDIRYINDPVFNPNWRENGAVDFLAEVCLMDWLGELPIVTIDDQIVFAADVEEIEIEGKLIPIAKKTECTDGVCKVNFSTADNGKAVAVA